MVKDANGKINPDPANTVNALKAQSVFSSPKQDKTVNDAPDFFQPSDTSDSGLKDIEFSKEDIEKACSELSDNAAAGPDGVPAHNEFFVVKRGN